MIVSGKRKSTIITEIECKDKCLFLKSERGILKIKPITPSIARISYTENGEFRREKGLGICYDEGFDDWTYSQADQEIVLELGVIKLVVDRKSGAITYYKGEKKLLEESKSQCRVLEYFDSYKTYDDGNTKVEEVETPDGIKTIIREASRVFDKKLCHTKLALNFNDTEKIYGLGQNMDDSFNLRGTTQYLYQANMNIVIPFFLSTNGYGLLSSTSGVSIFNDNNAGSYFFTDADEEMDYYFIEGVNFDEIIKSYRFLTGKASMIPKWSFGFIQSQERYESQEEILALAEEFKKREIGVDCIVQDWMYWEKNKWGQKSFDKSRYPDVPGMIKKLGDDHIHFMISIWPTMAEGTENRKEFDEAGFMLTGSKVYDAFNPEARKLFWKHLKEGIYSQGVRAFWFDSSEPFTPECSGNDEKTIREYDYFRYIEQVSRFIPRELINAYAFEHSQTLYYGQRQESDKERVFNLTRSIYTGGQRFGTVIWSGDTATKWSELKTQVVKGLNMCVTGIPYWTLDIGGFFVKRQAPWHFDGDFENAENDLGFKEIFTRWFQLGAFLPLFRSHGTDVSRSIWDYGDKGDMFYDAIKEIIDIRYSLIPYIYTLAADVHYKDATMMRMLAFDFMDDDVATDARDQFLLGESIMVCPVLEPMYYEVNSVKLDKKKTRRVYMPKGADWYDFYTNEKYEGGKWYEVDAPINKIPVYVKAGSIIPTTKPVHNTYESSNSEIIMKVYSGKDATYSLYSDDGDGYGYEKGEYKYYDFKWNEKTGTLEQPDCDKVFKYEVIK